ncbi:MAG: DUF6384 family protein [Devosia sp.]
MSAATAEKAPLDDVMLAMDVVDTLRHNQDLVARELAGEEREKQLIARLRDLYHQQGIEVPDAILKEGVAALGESRFVYAPPKPSLSVTLARLYVSRTAWLRPVAAVAIVVALVLGGYFLVWGPYQASLVERARIELTETLPAQMDALYQTIYEETKVQQAVTQAEAIRTRGKAAAAEGDRTGAEAAVADLTEVRDTLRLEYRLTIVSRPDERSGFYRTPDVNSAATNYYIVVEALDASGRALPMQIRNEEDSRIETVSIWGLRVPEPVYRQVEADKRDDGIVESNVAGNKEFGFLDVNYALPVLGGTVTHW